MKNIHRHGFNVNTIQHHPDYNRARAQLIAKANDPYLLWTLASLERHMARLAERAPFSQNQAATDLKFRILTAWYADLIFLRSGYLSPSESEIADLLAAEWEPPPYP